MQLLYVCVWSCPCSSSIFWRTNFWEFEWDDDLFMLNPPSLNVTIRLLMEILAQKRLLLVQRHSALRIMAAGVQFRMNWVGSCSYIGPAFHVSLMKKQTRLLKTVAHDSYTVSLCLCCPLASHSDEKAMKFIQLERLYHEQLLANLSSIQQQWGK